MKLNKKTEWYTTHPSGLIIRIIHWGVERAGFDSLNNGKGVWNYYIICPERLLKEEFEQYWLKAELVRFTPESSEYVTHSYMNAPFANVDWHGGITYYDKLGQEIGHRSIELGCDYNHLFDLERNFDYRLEDVYQEALQTAKQLAELFKLTPIEVTSA